MVRRFFRPLVLALTAICGAAAVPVSDLGTALAAQSLSAPATPAPGGITIAAVINEDIITLFDVQSRANLVITTSGLENTPDMQRRLVPQVVDILIEERLKLQEAARLKIKITETEIRQSVESIEQRNNMPAGGFRAMLDGRGIDMSALNTQVEADLSWAKVVRQSLQSEVSVNPDEVNIVLARARANQGKAEYLLAEISLPVSSPAQEPVMRDMANRLVTQARGGTPFPSLAQQFSQSPTAVLGGDLGWVVRGEMEAEIDDILARLEPGQISDPLRTSVGYHIVMLRERRTAGAADPRMAVVTLNQIYLPTQGGRALAPERLAQLSETISGFTTCEEMDKLGSELETPGSGPIPPVYVGSLPPVVANVVLALSPGRTSPAIEVGGARLFLQVCMRRDDSGVPSGEQIMSDLENEKLQNVARQRLRDLRRQALIDIRI